MEADRGSVLPSEMGPGEMERELTRLKEENRKLTQQAADDRSAKQALQAALEATGVERVATAKF